MPEKDDIHPLTQFVLNGSDEAFAALVRKYANLIYSTARRMAQEDLAHDITQATFIVLAKKAA